MFIARYQWVVGDFESVQLMEVIRLKNRASYDPVYSGITLSFFPINILLGPLFIPLLVFKSARLNDFALKIQYVYLVTLYFMLMTIASTFILPMLFLKITANELFLFVKSTGFEGKQLVRIGFRILVSPIAITASLLTDILSSIALLFREERHFDQKYQDLNAEVDQSTLD